MSEARLASSRVEAGAVREVEAGDQEQAFLMLNETQHEVGWGEMVVVHEFDEWTKHLEEGNVKYERVDDGEIVRRLIHPVKPHRLRADDEVRRYEKQVMERVVW